MANCERTYPEESVVCSIKFVVAVAFSDNYLSFGNFNDVLASAVSYVIFLKMGKNKTASKQLQSFLDRARI